jgi:hypothetical protein
MFARERHRRFLFTLVAWLAVCLCSVAHAQDSRRYDRQVSRGTGEDQAQGSQEKFAAAVDMMIRACRESAVILKATPLDVILQAVQPTDEQRAALEKVRSVAQAAAVPLDTNCPKNSGIQLSEKIVAIDRALELMADSLQTLRPALASFYASLDDEQKAQLVAISLSKSQSARKSALNEGAGPEDGISAEQNSTCLQWADTLRSWPVRQIESAVNLSDFQRASLYELTAALYRSAGDLAQACPSKNRPIITPLGRLEAKVNLIRALRQDIQAIQPFAAAFENAMSDAQRSRLEAVIGPPPDKIETVGSSVRRTNRRYRER